MKAACGVTYGTWDIMFVGQGGRIGAYYCKLICHQGTKGRSGRGGADVLLKAGGSWFPTRKVGIRKKGKVFYKHFCYFSGS